MAINRYDTPAQANFVNTYVPIPFDDIMKAGLLKQARIEESQKASDEALASLNAIRVAAPDEAAYLGIQGNYSKRLDDLANQSPIGSMDFMRGVNKIRSEMTIDPTLRMMASNKTAYDKLVASVKEAQGKYGPDSVPYYRALKQLNEFSNGAKDANGNIIKGTQYLMSRGTGALEPEGIGKPASIAETLDKYLEPVKADLVGTEGLDKDQKYKIGSKVSQVSPEKLGSVLGIGFKVVVRGGKKVLEVDRNNINPPADLASTEGGMYLRAKAEQWADNSGGKYTVDEAYKMLYADQAMRSINSHVSKQSEYTIDADPFALQKQKRDLDNFEFDMSSSVAIASAASKFNSIDAVNNGIASYDVKKENVKKGLQEYIDQYGIKPVNVGGVEKYIDSNGVDRSDDMRKKRLEYKEYETQQEHLKNMLVQARADARIPSDYTGPSEALKADADTKAKDVVTRRINAMRQGTSNQPEISEEKYKEMYDQAYNEYITSKDPYAKRMNQILEDNAEKSSFVATVTRFGDKQYNQAGEDYFKTAIQNAAVYDTDGMELTPNEKDKLAKYSFVTSENGQGNNVHFEGALWNTEKGMYQFAYSINNSSMKSGGKTKNSNSKTILVEAPAQAVDLLLKRGLTDEASQIIQQQMSAMYGDPNKQVTVSFGNKEDDPNAGEIRKLTPSEMESNKYPAGAQFELIVPMKDENTNTVKKTSYTFSDATEVSSFYKWYRKAVEANAGKALSKDEIDTNKPNIITEAK